jgi:hypothetical protein
MYIEKSPIRLRLGVNNVLIPPPQSGTVWCRGKARHWFSRAIVFGK